MLQDRSAMRSGVEDNLAIKEFLFMRAPVRKLLGNSVGFQNCPIHRNESSLGFGCGDPGLEPANSCDPVVTSIRKTVPIRRHLRFHRYRDEKVGNLTHLYARKAGACDAHNRQGISVDGELLIQDVRVAAEVAGPITVAKHRHGISAGGAFVLRSKHSSEIGPDAEHLEIISTDEFRFGEL